MSKPQDYTPRLSIDIGVERHTALNKLLPAKTKTAIYKVITDDLIRLLQKCPAEVIGALLTRSIKLENYLDLEATCDNCGNNIDFKRFIPKDI